jgi:hypothetical protein
MSGWFQSWLLVGALGAATAQAAGRIEMDIAADSKSALTQQQWS